jgi:hypothetical protein
LRVKERILTSSIFRTKYSAGGWGWDIELIKPAVVVGGGWRIRREGGVECYPITNGGMVNCNSEWARPILYNYSGGRGWVGRVTPLPDICPLARISRAPSTLALINKFRIRPAYTQLMRFLFAPLLGPAPLLFAPIEKNFLVEFVYI